MTKNSGLCFIAFLFCFTGFNSEAQQAPEDSLVKKLTAVCGKDGIKVSVRFSQPFRGIVYSDGHYDTPHCVFIDQEKNARKNTVPETRFSFVIPADECGTKFHDPGSALSSQHYDNTSLQPVNELANEVYMENTVMFQQNHFIQEQGDLAQTLRCVWQKEIRRPLHATLPLAIRGKHRQKSHEEKKQFVKLTSPLSPPVTGALAKDFAKEYLTSSQQRHADIRKKVQSKGQVESVSYGNRRSGKSLNLDAPVMEKQSQYAEEVLLYRNPTNITALPFKANHSNGAETRFSIVAFNPSILFILLMLELAWTSMF